VDPWRGAFGLLATVRRYTAPAPIVYVPAVKAFFDREWHVHGSINIRDPRGEEKLGTGKAKDAGDLDRGRRDRHPTTA
jgi:hypothetical protein